MRTVEKCLCFVKSLFVFNDLLDNTLGLDWLKVPLFGSDGKYDSWDQDQSKNGEIRFHDLDGNSWICCDPKSEKCDCDQRCEKQRYVEDCVKRGDHAILFSGVCDFFHMS